MTKTPIAYIIFNRPQHTNQSFKIIREQRPSKLFIIADGPRSDHPEDVELCAAVRKIVEYIDWPCEIHRNYAKSNLGLKQRVSTGLDWVFDLVERAIVLEDDCLAHSDFFRFCDELLDCYENDGRVAVITGNNFQDGQKRGNGSYYFSRYNHCWGWATWRSSWRHYDGNLLFWTEWQASSEWRRLMKDRRERSYWSNIFEEVSKGNINSWAYPWTASVWRVNGLTATPNVNLVSNIGCGNVATNTNSEHVNFAGLPIQALGVIEHPSLIERCVQADEYVFQNIFNPGYLKLIRWKIFKIFKNWRRNKSGN